MQVNLTAALQRVRQTVKDGQLVGDEPFLPRGRDPVPVQAAPYLPQTGAWLRIYGYGLPSPY